MNNIDEIRIFSIQCYHSVMNLPQSTIDLHTHTTASDGHLTPSELVDLALTNHVEMLAITDHDTTWGYESVKDDAKQRGLQLVSGVEISTTWGGQGVHIVGLNFDPKHAAMTQLLDFQRDARAKRYHVILDKLAKAKVPISEDELLNHVGSGNNNRQIGRPHIAQAMVAKGYVNTVEKAFKQYLGAGKIGDVKNGWASLADTVSAITESGGIAVIAHPDKYKMTRSKTLRLIDEFIELGGRGIEVISAKQHIDITNKYAKIANDRKLYASIGSDFHRHVSYAPDVGKISPLPHNITPIWQAFNQSNEKLS